MHGMWRHWWVLRRALLFCWQNLTSGTGKNGPNWTGLILQPYLTPFFYEKLPLPSQFAGVQFRFIEAFKTCFNSSLIWWSGLLAVKICKWDEEWCVSIYTVFPKKLTHFPVLGRFVEIQTQAVIYRQSYSLIASFIFVPWIFWINNFRRNPLKR